MGISKNAKLMKQDEWIDKLCNTIEEMQKEFVNILDVAINKLESNDYNRTDIKISSTTNYLKNQREIIKIDLSIHKKEPDSPLKLI